MITDDPLKQGRWATKLEEIMIGINTRMNHVTGWTPYEVQFGREYEPKISEALTHDTRHQQLEKIAHKRLMLRFLQNSRQFEKC
jgi:hypothetical protein